MSNFNGQLLKIYDFIWISKLNSKNLKKWISAPFWIIFVQDLHVCIKFPTYLPWAHMGIKYNKLIVSFSSDLLLTWKIMFAKLRSSHKWKRPIVPESLLLELTKNSSVCFVFRLSSASDNKTSESNPLKITQILRSPMKLLKINKSCTHKINTKA